MALAGGCIPQTFWNLIHGYPPDRFIQDLDVIYFDPQDLSLEGEADQAGRVRALFQDLPIPMEIVNQARVHLWCQKRFGREIPPFTSIRDAVAHFHCTATCVAIYADPSGDLQVDAPLGLDDLLHLVVRPNKRLAPRDVYESKSARWKENWPRLNVLPWEEP